MRRTVCQRRSLGTGSKSADGPDPNTPLPPPPVPRPPRPTPPVAARVPPRGKVMRSPRGGGRGLGDALRLQPALRVDSGLAAVRRGGHCLTIAMVVDVAGDEHAIDLPAGLVVDHEVARRVDLEPLAERLRVRAIADGDEHA